MTFFVHRLLGCCVAGAAASAIACVSLERFFLSPIIIATVVVVDEVALNRISVNCPLPGGAFPEEPLHGDCGDVVASEQEQEEGVFVR